MKKIISYFIIFSIVLTNTQLLCFAIVSPEDTIKEFDINVYTMEDFLDMNSEEKIVLLKKFIETYNPYGMCDYNEVEYMSEISSDADLQWESGRDITGDEQEIATHQLLTMEAFARFVEKHGFYENVDSAEILMITLLLAAGSGLPDIDETDGLFKAHFYDPDTGENIFSETSPTARTKTSSHYNNAYNILSKNFHMDVQSDEFVNVLESLGRALHYLQDLCEPHHASNKIAVLSNHSQFESYVEDNIDAFLNSIPSNLCYMHKYVREHSASDIAHYAACIAKPYYEEIKWGYNFYDVGLECVSQSVYFSEALIYKLFYECSIA